MKILSVLVCICICICPTVVFCDWELVIQTWNYKSVEFCHVLGTQMIQKCKADIVRGIEWGILCKTWKLYGGIWISLSRCFVCIQYYIYKLMFYCTVETVPYVIFHVWSSTSSHSSSDHQWDFVIEKFEKMLDFHHWLATKSTWCNSNKIFWNILNSDSGVSFFVMKMTKVVNQRTVMYGDKVLVMYKPSIDKSLIM